MKKLLTTKQVAELLNLSPRRIRAKIAQNHFPNITQCLCERKNWLIPIDDLPIKARYIKDDENHLE